MACFLQKLTEIIILKTLLL